MTLLSKPDRSVRINRTLSSAQINSKDLFKERIDLGLSWCGSWRNFVHDHTLQKNKHVANDILPKYKVYCFYGNMTY